MKHLKFERIAGEGEDALYNLYINGARVGTALYMCEVMEKISEAYEKGALELPTEKAVTL